MNDAEIVDPEPELHPSSTPGGAVDEAASPTPAQALGQEGDGAISVPANADLASRSVSLPTEAPVMPEDAGTHVDAHAPVLTSSTSPAEPSPAADDGLTSVNSVVASGASEGAPPARVQVSAWWIDGELCVGSDFSVTAEMWRELGEWCLRMANGVESDGPLDTEIPEPPSDDDEQASIQLLDRLVAA